MAGPEAEGPTRHFGRYQLLHRFASGGMADLYLARLSGEEGFERILALKVIHSHLSLQPEFVRMFIDEARLASRISHPNVALTLDLGRVERTYFIAMEYVDGESISSLLRHTRPPVPFAMRIISDAATGLHAAHELRGSDGNLLNVVHHDVSPGNILVTYEGTVKVVDFGVARARGSLHTTTDTFKGKFGYMSPEQFSDPLSVDRRTDVFALGVVLYEMTTWTRLFRRDTEAATVERVLHGEIPSPSQLVPDYPPALERTVMRALQRVPDQRQATAQELHEELEEAIAAVGRPVPSSAIGKMMHEVFSSRIAEKRALLDQSSAQPAFDTARERSSSSVVLGSSVVTFGGRRRAMVLAVTVAVLVLLAAVLAGVALLRRQAAPTSAASVAPRSPDASVSQRRSDGPPRLVTIRVSAMPAEAALTLDGAAMSNPFEIQRPASTASAALVAAAPGYRTQRFEVSLARGGNWTVALSAEPHAAPRRKKSKLTITKESKKQSKAAQSAGRGQFLDNPYK